jgi:hypothetical protein
MGKKKSVPKKIKKASLAELPRDVRNIIAEYVEKSWSVTKKGKRWSGTDPQRARERTWKKLHKQYQKVYHELDLAMLAVPREWRSYDGNWLHGRYVAFMEHLRTTHRYYREDAMEQAEVDAKKQLTVRKQMAYAAGLLVRKCKKASL